MSPVWVDRMREFSDVKFCFFLAGNLSFNCPEKNFIFILHIKSNEIIKDIKLSVMVQKYFQHDQKPTSLSYDNRTNV